MDVTILTTDPACRGRIAQLIRELGHVCVAPGTWADLAIVDCEGSATAAVVGDFADVIAVRTGATAAAIRAVIGQGASAALPGAITVEALTAAVVASEARIAKRRAARRAIAESEGRFQQIVRVTPDLVTMFRVDGTITLNNVAHTNILGYDEDGLIGRNIRELIHADDMGRTARTLARVAAGEPQPEIIIRLLHSAGHYVPFDVTADRLIADGRVVGLVSIARDVTERLSAEALIGQLKDRFSRAFNFSPLASVVTEAESRRILSVNERFMALTGYTRDELLGHSALELGIWASLEDRDRVTADSAADGTVHGFETVLRRRDGALRAVRLSIVLLESESGGEVLSVIEDITEQKHTSASVDRLTTTLAVQQETSLDAILVVGPAGEVMSYNQRYLDMWQISREEVMGGLERRNAAARRILAEPEVAVELVQKIYASPGLLVQHEVSLKGGRTLELYTAPLAGPEGADYGRVWYYRDITERRKAEQARLELERKLLEAQKLESLGVLAGGIAHDFNNLLVAIMGNAGLATMELAADSPVRGYLAEIELASQRAADLARQMLAYSGKGKFVVAGVDLSALVEEMSHLLSVSLPKRATLELDVDRALPLTQGDATQVRQVVMNLVLNAAESLTNGEGVIRVTTGAAEMTAAAFGECVLSPELPAGAYLYLDVADTGCGMDAATLARIFDPFYTTKFTGRGLGLAAVLGIVRGHKGALRVRSTPGAGSTFRLLLPVAAGVEAEIAASPAATGRRAVGTVLVADEDASVRGVGAQMLERAGFRVVTAATIEEARAVIAGGGLAAVVMDPQILGDAAEQGAIATGATPVVALTTYGEADAAERYGGGRFVAFVQKPFSVGALVDAVVSAAGG